MAKIYPSLEEINQLSQGATEGELHLTKRLSEILDDTFEIYFQPFLNGDKPDIIVMRKNGGILVIEVKDWNLDSYFIKDNDIHIKLNDALIKSPIAQVCRYRNNIIDLHMRSFTDNKVFKPNCIKSVVTAVYFHNESERKAKDFFKNITNRSTAIWGFDSLENNTITNFVSINRLNGNSIYFNDEFYNEAKRLFQPSYQNITDKEKINFTSEQKQLLINPKKRIKVKGVAGSGKTLVLAERAVDAYIRAGQTGKVLIITYNITLKNYILEKLNRALFFRNIKTPAQNIFTVINYHLFMYQETNNLGLTLPDCVDDVINLNVPEHKKYNAILIDELQDFKENWMRNLKINFLKKDIGELFILADEKQNIYSREMPDNKLPYTGINGFWNTLNKSMRLEGNIAYLAKSYQKYFWKDNYDDFEIPFQGNMLAEPQSIKYLYVSNRDSLFYNKVCNYVISFVKNYNVNNNDVAILSNQVENVRELEYMLRKNYGINVDKTFEMKEEFEQLKKEYSYLENILNEELYKIRRNKKYNFFMNSGKMKLSTVHSFKGWEIHTLFMIIDDCENAINEVVYASLTRAIKNLVIINIGNTAQHEFFKNCVDK